MITLDSLIQGTTLLIIETYTLACLISKISQFLISYIYIIIRANRPRVNGPGTKSIDYSIVYIVWDEVPTMVEIAIF